MFSRSKAIVLGCLATVAVVILCCVFGLVKGWVVAREAVDQPVADVDKYRNQGLEYGVELDQTPNITTSDRVVFDDRVVLRPDWDDDDLEECASSIGLLAAAISGKHPNIVTSVMFAPMRLSYEGDFSSDAEYLKLVENAYEDATWADSFLRKSLSSRASYVSCVEVFHQHQDEYLFNRTNINLTALGSYYASQQYLEAAGFDTFPISDFNEYVKRSTHGNLVNAADNVVEYQYYYLYKGYNPLVDLIEDGGSEPMISLVRGSTGAFLGAVQNAGNDIFRFDGLADNERTLLLIGSPNAAVIAPWFVTNYSQIVYVNLTAIKPSEPSFWSLFDIYGATDCLIVQDESLLSNAEYTQKYALLASAA